MRSWGVRDLAVIVGLVVVDVLLFWPVIFEGQFVPRGGGDLVSFLYPRYAFVAQAVRHGTLPLWDPYLYGGQPYLADVQSGLLYPINLLAFAAFHVFDYHKLELLAIGHYALAGIFAYILGRQLRLGRFGALTAAVTWEASGFLVAQLGHYNLIAVVVWVPLVLALLQPALEGGSLAWVAGAAMALAVSTYAGHTQMSLYAGLMIAIYVAGYVLWGGAQARVRGERLDHEDLETPRKAAKNDARRPYPFRDLFARFRDLRGPDVVRAVRRPDALRASDGPRVPFWLAPLRALVVLAVWTGLLCVVQLWPGYQLTEQSVRADITYADATQFAFLPQKLILFLVPHFYGQTPDQYWGPPSLTENYLYVGIVPLALALLALLCLRDWRVRTFGVIAVLGLLLSFADWTPLHGWMFALVPGFDKVRAPGRFLFFVDLGIAMLAGLGADVLSRPLAAYRRPLFRLFLAGWAVFAAGLLLVAAPLVYLRLFVNQAQNAALVQQIDISTSSFALTLLYVLATLAFLAAYRYRWIRGLAVPVVAIGLILVDLVGNNAVVNPTPDDPTAGFQHPAVVDFLSKNLGDARIDTVTGVEDIWQPDAAALYGFRSLWGLYDPLTLTDYYWLWKIHVPGRSSRLYDLLGARYLLGHKNVVLDTSKFRLAFSGDPQINVYEDPRALPRAFFVDRSVVAPSHDAALAAIKAKDFDPGQEVVLESGTPTNGPAADAVPAQFVVDGPNSVIVRVTAPRGGYLVLADPYYGGWQATVDGKSAPLLRADWTFRAVPVGPGQHEIAFRFRPRSLIVAGGISALAWVLALAAVIWGVRSVAKKAGKTV
ncbi:MAG TPA: YfhO family protein [Chloroflexota bacterium]|nr:YfhO family protein [Chloroflexota bacterium]